MFGNTGDDRLRGNKGNDRMHGGPGDDDMHGSLDGERDYFYCGDGQDYVLVGSNDVVATDCEVVDRV
jgi:Ca2+-binding RTX toxin-like protein